MSLNLIPFMRLIIVFFLLASVSVAGQSLPDSLIVIKNTYVTNFEGGESLYQSERFSVLYNGNSYFLNGGRISKSKIRDLLSSIKDSSNGNNSLAKYQIDTNLIKSNPKDLLRFYSEKDKIEWNEQQKQFIFKELTNLHNYTERLNGYLAAGGSYTMHSFYKYEYIIQFFSSGKIADEIRSRKSVWGYKMPWTNQSGDTIYNFNIEKALGKIVGTKEKTVKPLTGDKLLSYLVNQIIDNNMRSLYKLSAYSYEKEIQELNTDFQIVSFEEVYGRGRYIWDEPPTMKIVLKNSQMLENVYLVFMASKQGRSIYSRDSIKKDYSAYVKRIQAIKFVSDYLNENPGTRLDVYYFNNKGINEYNIERVNKSPKRWANHDKYVEILKRSEKIINTPNFDLNQAIKTSQRYDCGCNYRFDRSYIEQAIFFEIHDANNNSSFWFLLPDNKVLLYIMDNATALNFKRSDFNETKEYGLIYPCALFDTNGNRVLKSK